LPRVYFLFSALSEGTNEVTKGSNIMRKPLTNHYIQNIIKSNLYGRHYDSGFGIHLWLKQSGKNYWIYRYQINKKRQEMTLGNYPTLTLSDARKLARIASEKIDKGINPISEKNEALKLKEQENLNKPTFKEFCLQYIEIKKPEWRNLKHGDQWINSLSDYAFEKLGSKYLHEIETEDILSVLQPIWAIKTETAKRLRGRIELILSAATTRKLRTGINPAIWRGHLDTLLPKPNKIRQIKHHEALSYEKLPSFIELLQGHDCMAAYALEFTILNAVRSGETLRAKRSEISDDLWIIPAERMKAFKEHRIPLTERAKKLIQKAIETEPDSEYIFSNSGKSMCCNAMLNLIKRMGYDFTTHGFRSTFRDWVAEATDHSQEVAEMALAHSIQNKVEKAYRRGDLLEKRRRLMDDWMNYCLKTNKSNLFEIKQVA
jgi:integrase